MVNKYMLIENFLSSVYMEYKLYTYLPMSCYYGNVQQLKYCTKKLINTFWLIAIYNTEAIGLHNLV